MSDLQKYPYHQKGMSFRGGRVVFCCFIEERRGTADIARYWRVIDAETGAETYPDRAEFSKAYVLESELGLPAAVLEKLSAVPSWWAWRANMMDKAAGLLPEERQVTS